MQQTVTVSAPGKLMFFGEHAVVYNHPCIVTAVGQRMKATISLLDSTEFQLDAPDVQVTGYKKQMSEIGHGHIPKGAKFVEIAVKSFLENQIKSGMTVSQGIRIETRSEFSSLFGFGSSSASTVCVVKALSELFGAHLSHKQIFDISYKTVLDIQGKGSGFDVAAAVYGGTLYFLTGGKVIEPLHITTIPLIVGYSGIKADTVTLINKVSEQAKLYPEKIQLIYTKIETIVEEAKKAILINNWEEVGTLANKNQKELEALGVSIPKLGTMIAAALDNGAFGAKLSGAGGGDCMFALASETKKIVISNAIQQAGGEILQVQTNVEGVRIEP